ncbi:PAS domain-containing protein [Caldimonas tepidiphila]|uniref:PAS domain-containing protein n=1 Tax=Caldimonas tepidiphila TaxID=2315841 RepID=UPI0014752198|nr:PAS domain-containing protein [Caldimonas tepidiphila]
MPNSNTIELAPRASELNHWMFEGSPDCVKMLDLDGKLAAMNRNGQRCMEIDDFDSVCGLRWPALWPEESRTQVEAALEAARAGRVGHFSAFCPTAKGTPKWWDVTVSPVLDDHGRVERLLSVSRDVSALRASEQGLRETAARLQFALDAAEIGEWDLDLVHDTMRRSRRHDQCFGYGDAAPDWSLAIFLRHVHPTDRAMVARAFDDALSRQQDWRFECRVIWPDGSVHWILSHGSVYEGDGKPVRMLGIVADITARKRSEAVAEGQKRAFEMSVAGAPLPEILDVLARASEASTGGTLMASILLLDPDGERLRYGAGPSLPAEYNRAIDGVVIGPSVGSCGTAAYLRRPVFVNDIATDPHWSDYCELALSHGLRACWSMPICSSLGAEGPVLGTLASYCREVRAPTAQERESMALLANTAALVLERRRAEEERRAAEAALRASEERVRLATEAAELGIWTWEADCDRVSWENERPYEIFGQPRAAGPLSAARFLAERVHPDDRAACEQALEATRRSGAPLRFEGRFLRGDGRTGWIGLNGRAGPRAEDGGLRVVGIMADITERKQSEASLRRLAEELAEADRRKTEFLATLAHELRNPLAPIRTGLEVMRLSGGNPGAAARTREMMERQLSHLVHLVDDLLDVARITRGKLELKKERVDLRGVVASAVETSLPHIEAGCHDLAVQLPDEPLPLDADPTRIAQVLSNLLNNAAKYTPSGGRIRLSVSREGEQVLVAVTDTGIGLPAQALSTVFQMFAQIGHATERGHGGLGIGLTLVRRLVELHGGTVEAASAGPGQGSTFMVRLPLAAVEAGEAPPAVREGQPSAPGSDRGLRVLVVDDNVDAAETLAALLGMIGHTTRVAHDGLQALDAAREFRPEAVFLDLGMPGMDGYEVARALRGTPGFARTLLVALTGWGAESDRALSREAGFDQHLTKPADLAVIDALLKKLAAARRASPGDQGAPFPMPACPS